MDFTDPGDYRQRISKSFARQGVVQAIKRWANLVCLPV